MEKVFKILHFFGFIFGFTITLQFQSSFRQ